MGRVSFNGRCWNVNTKRIPPTDTTRVRMKRTVAAMVPSQLKPTALTESPWLSSSRTGGTSV